MHGLDRPVPFHSEARGALEIGGVRRPSRLPTKVLHHATSHATVGLPPGVAQERCCLLGCRPATPATWASWLSETRARFLPCSDHCFRWSRSGGDASPRGSRSDVSVRPSFLLRL